jgi:hypothetical protein
MGEKGVEHPTSIVPIVLVLPHGDKEGTPNNKRQTKRRGETYNAPSLFPLYPLSSSPSHPIPSAVSLSLPAIVLLHLKRLTRGERAGYSRITGDSSTMSTMSVGTQSTIAQTQRNDADAWAWTGVLLNTRGEACAPTLSFPLEYAILLYAARTYPVSLSNASCSRILTDGLLIYSYHHHLDLEDVLDFAIAYPAVHTPSPSLISRYYTDGPLWTPPLPLGIGSPLVLCKNCPSGCSTH